MKFRKYIAIFFVSVSWSCEEVFDDGKIDFQSEDLIVIEGVLSNERKNHRVKITQPYATQNENENPVSGATVAIVDSDEELTILTEFPQGSGEYYTDSLRAVFGKFYLLVVQYEGKEYRAFDASPGGELLDPLLVEEKIVDDQILYTIPYSESGNNANYITYDIDWSQTPSCSQASVCEGRMVYYDLKNIDVQEIYAPEREDLFFPGGSRVIRKRFSVSDQYRDYLRALLSETEWRGGFFDINRDNIPTNMTEGALGFFAVTTVDSDTLIVAN